MGRTLCMTADPESLALRRFLHVSPIQVILLAACSPAQELADDGYQKHWSLIECCDLTMKCWSVHQKEPFCITRDKVLFLCKLSYPKQTITNSGGPSRQYRLPSWWLWLSHPSHSKCRRQHLMISTGQALQSWVDGGLGGYKRSLVMCFKMLILMLLAKSAGSYDVKSMIAL